MPFAHRFGLFLVHCGCLSHVEIGLLEIPHGVDMIVLEEVDPLDAMLDLQAEQSPMGMRRRRSVALPFLRRASSDAGSVQNQPGSPTQAPVPQSAHAISGQSGSMSSILRTVEFSCQTYFFDAVTGTVDWPQRNDDVSAGALLDHVSSSETGSVASLIDVESDMEQQEHYSFGPLAVFLNAGGASVVSNGRSTTVGNHPLPVVEVPRSSNSGMIQVTFEIIILEFIFLHFAPFSCCRISQCMVCLNCFAAGTRKRPCRSQST
jgi:hypothetical protein